MKNAKANWNVFDSIGAKGKMLLMVSIITLLDIVGVAYA